MADEYKGDYGETALEPQEEYAVEEQAENTVASGAPESLQSNKPLKPVSSVQVTEEAGHTTTTKEM